MNSVIREGNGVSRATRGGDQALGSLLYANEKSARVVQGSCIEEEMKLQKVGETVPGCNVESFSRRM